MGVDEAWHPGGVDADFLEVSPSTIRLCSGIEFGLVLYRGAVIPGDWDQSTKEFRSLEVFEAMRDVLTDRLLEWRDTE
jgi:hypothetical protein